MPLFPDYTHNRGDKNHPREAMKDHTVGPHTTTLTAQSPGQCNGEKTPGDTEVSKLESLLQRDSRGSFKNGMLLEICVKIYHIITNKKEKGNSASLLYLYVNPAKR